MKKNHNDIPFKNQLMLSYILILGIILIIGVMLYHSSYNQVKTGINKQNKLTLSSSVNRLDNTMELMNATARQIAAKPLFDDLTKLTREDEPDFYYMAYKTQMSLKTLTPLEVLLPISHYFIYMKNSNYAISSTSFLDYDFYKRHSPNDQLKTQPFSGILMNHKLWNRFLPFGDLQIDSKNLIYIYPLFASVTTDKTVDSVLCYEFNYNSIKNFFSDLNFYEDGYLVAYDKKGSQMFLLSDTIPMASYAALSKLDYNDQTAYFTSRKNHKNLLVTSFTSSYNNWTYYLVQPEEKAYYSITPYQHFFTIITITAIVLGCLIAVFFSIFGSRRLAQLANELNMTESLASSLNLQVEKQKPMIIESYMRRIMEGSITTNEEMLYIIEDLSLNRPNCKFHVLYTEVSPSEDYHVQYTDMELCIQNYDMLVREALCRYYPDTGYIYKPSDRVFAILIASDKSVPVDQVISRDRDTFITMHKELLENYGIWIYGGFGGRNGMISNTWKSYQQAKEAKSITTIEKYILTADFTHSNDIYYYPESLSVQLSGFISLGNKDQVSELFKLIKKENTIMRNLSFTQLRWLISDVRATVFKKRHNIIDEDLPIEKLKILDLIDRQFEEELSLDILKTIALELCDVCGSQGNEQILKIQEYINNNYHDPGLCLTKISDEFGISENYFSHLFKKEVSENFSTYLERLRMAKAKEMILESDVKLSSLYQYVGYNNAASFRRAFKKNFGVSPKEMRDKINAK